MTSSTIPSTITSNSNIEGEVEYKGTFTFTTDKKVKASYKYVSSTGEEILFDSVNLTKNGNTYTISNIIQDVYIDNRRFLRQSMKDMHMLSLI